MLRIGPEPANGSISAINIRDNEKVVGILKEPTGEYSLDVSGTINCGALLVNGSTLGSGGSGVWDLSDSNTISYTNGNVGIGTTSPSTVLHVQKDGINEVLQTWYSNLGNTAGERSINLISPTSDSDDAPFHFQTGNAITFRIDSTEALNIDSGGNVGIGTTSPSERLTINQNTSIPCLGVRNGNSAYGYNRAQIAFGYAGTNTYQHFIQTRHNGGGTSGNAIDFYVCDTTQYNSITSGVTHTMSLDGGNVGIGTTNPLGKLHVVEQTGSSPSVSYPTNVTGTIILDHEDNAGTSSIVFRSKVNRASDFGYIKYQDDRADQSGERSLLTIGNENDGGYDGDHIALMPQGYVGIGKTTPSSTLHVYGNSSPSLTVEYPGNSVILQSWNYTNDIGNTRGMDLFSPGDWSSSSFSGFANTFIFRTADAFSFYTDDNHVCHMSSIGAFIVYNFVNSSDDRLKSNEIPITDALTTIMKLNPMTYDKYNNMDKSGNYFRESGLISQDIWYQVPELRHIVTLGSEYKDGTSTVPTPIDVSNNELLEDADYNNLGWSTTEPSSVKYLSLIAYLIKAVQELNIQRQQEKDALQASHDSLQASHDSLTAKNDALQNELTSLKTILQSKGILD